MSQQLLESDSRNDYNNTRNRYSLQWMQPLILYDKKETYAPKTGRWPNAQKPRRNRNTITTYSPRSVILLPNSIYPIRIWIFN